MSTVLVVEGDPDLRASVESHLQPVGLETLHAPQGATALRLLKEREADLVILDLLLPDILGLDVCREIRADATTAHVPIILVGARDKPRDTLRGLECGADDYLAKPISMRELVLRVTALLRRSAGAAPRTGPKIAAGEIVIDQAAHRVFIRDAEAALTPTEYNLLAMFMMRPGRVLSRQQLLNHVWHTPSNVTLRTVDAHIKRLRTKLGAEGAAIVTVRGVGYRFVRPGTI